MKKQPSLSVHIPIKLVRKNGRKRILLPDLETLPQLDPDQSDPMIQALLCAHKWQKLIDANKARTAEELAEKMKISHTYVCRVLRLNLLAPDIRRAILDGRQPKGLRVIDILQPIPIVWEEQRKQLGFAPPR
jgi:CBS domain-containing protein